jgi:hypothetical protein
MTPTLRERLSEALIINRSNSKCGACGKGASPHDTRHDDIVDWTPVPGGGCGIEWRYVTSAYTNSEEWCREMRPDLEWFDRWPGLGERAA